MIEVFIYDSRNSLCLIDAEGVLADAESTIVEILCVL